MAADLSALYYQAVFEEVHKAVTEQAEYLEGMAASEGFQAVDAQECRRIALRVGTAWRLAFLALQRFVAQIPGWAAFIEGCRTVEEGTYRLADLMFTNDVPGIVAVAQELTTAAEHIHRARVQMSEAMGERQ